MLKNPNETNTGIGVDVDFYLQIPEYIDIDKKFPQLLSQKNLKPLRIGFIGANSTGKTTLANKIAPLLNLEVLHETASVVVGDLGMQGHSNTSVDTQLAIYFGQLWAELSFKRFVSDRTLLDTVAHTIPAFEKKINEGDLGSKIVCNSLTHAMSVHVNNTYDAIFYLPIEFEAIEDGFRDTDKEFQKKLDDIIVSLVDRYDIKVIELSGSINERLKRALTHLDYQ
jgi:nicotinamide riboside kinase